MSDLIHFLCTADKIKQAINHFTACRDATSHLFHFGLGGGGVGGGGQGFGTVAIMFHPRSYFKDLTSCIEPISYSKIIPIKNICYPR